MSRKIAKRKLDNTIAIIVDGKDEKWYIEILKNHYKGQCPALKSIKIEPDLPQQKKVQELFNLAETKQSEGYKHIILIIDLDTVNNDPAEYRRFEVLYNRYQNIKEGQLTGRISAKNKWMQNLILIINNPCLEYWYIYHFKYTNKFFNDFDKLKSLLQKYLPDYEKSEKYYKSIPDIFTRLGAHDGLSEARTNAQKNQSFSVETYRICGISEMNKLFDFFDSL